MTEGRSQAGLQEEPLLEVKLGKRLMCFKKQDLEKRFGCIQ